MLCQILTAKDTFDTSPPCQLAQRWVSMERKSQKACSTRIYCQITALDGYKELELATRLHYCNTLTFSPLLMDSNQSQ